jgi:Prenylcysteine lyase
MCRYGWSPYFQHKLTASMVQKFFKIYELQDQGVTFSSALHLWKGLGLDHLLKVSLADNLRESSKMFGMHTINNRFINEVVAGQVRVNYNQNPHEIAALAGALLLCLLFCSLSAEGTGC